MRLVAIVVGIVVSPSTGKQNCTVMYQVEQLRKCSRKYFKPILPGSGIYES